MIMRLLGSYFITVFNPFSFTASDWVSLAVGALRNNYMSGSVKHVFTFFLCVVKSFGKPG